MLMKTGFSQQIVEKYSSTIFHENPCSGSRVVPYGQTDGRTDGRTDGQTSVMTLIVAFGSLAKAPEESNVAVSIGQWTCCEGQKKRSFP
jgi:hypothetical protein